MTYISQNFSDLVRYSLRGDLGFKYISEPKNWREDEKEFKRSTTVHGVFINLSNNLEFYKGDEYNDGGYNYLKQTYDLYGINANVLLVKEEKLNGKWVESYRGNLDFSTFSRKNNIIKIKFNESGLYEKIKARQSENLELERTTTMDGDEIDALETKIVALDGRDINIVNKLVANKTDTQLFVSASLANDEARAIPLVKVEESDSNVQTIYDYDVDENDASYGLGEPGNMFYDTATVETDLIIDFDLSIRVRPVWLEGSTTWARIDLVTYNGGDNYNFKEYETLIREDNFSSDGVTLNYIGQKTIKLQPGESLCLAVHVRYNESLYIYNQKSDVTIQERSFYDIDPKTKMVLPYETLNRILHIITNEEDVLHSTALGRTDILKADGSPKYLSDGEASLTGLSTGFWVRKFDDEKFTTSFKDFIESFESAWQLGYGIERFGLSERVKVEHISYFYQPYVTIVLDSQPKDIERTVASDYFYSSLELGYEKPSGDNLYEEAMGLDEYNIFNTYTTNISRVENKFEKKSKYRADSYGKEFARRKTRLDYPEEDTRYDKDIWLQDLKRGETDVFVERKWADDFEIPTNLTTLVQELNLGTTGVYSPQTATNLRFSPINLLLRWGFWIKGGLEKYKDKYIRYSSSNGNSNLKTQLRTDLYPDSKEYAESGNVLNGDLDKSLFIPEYIEFSFPVSSELLRVVNGTTEIGGNKIKNYYGLVQFVNEDGLNEFGYLMELKPNKEGKWKLLKANKNTTRRSALDRTDDVVIPTPTVDSFDYEINFEIDG